MANNSADVTSSGRSLIVKPRKTKASRELSSIAGLSCTSCHLFWVIPKMIILPINCLPSCVILLQ